MRSTTLFGIYAAVIIALIGGLSGPHALQPRKIPLVGCAHAACAGGLWDFTSSWRPTSTACSSNTATRSLIGDRDGGEGERELQAAINQNLSDIRAIIAREIQMVGEEEIEELELLDELEEDIRAVNAAIATLNASGDPIDTFVQIERLAALLDGDIDVRLHGKIVRSAGGRTGRGRTRFLPTRTPSAHGTARLSTPSSRQLPFCCWPVLLSFNGADQASDACPASKHREAAQQALCGDPIQLGGSTGVP